MLKRYLACTVLVASSLISAGCEGDDAEEHGADPELGGASQALLCFPPAAGSPPSPDYSATPNGSPTEVQSSGPANGCDLYTVRAYADSSDEARHVTISGVAFSDCDVEAQAVVYWKTCGGIYCYWQRETLTPAVHSFCDFGVCSCGFVAEFDLPNDGEDIEEVRAAGRFRADDQDDDVLITIEE